ncbi:hypothetical protein [Pedobacter roseus]|uniref:Uncharacterized protein n=1 Tax=Pedobacter roseus TaxID=336820 RepID=A0A7G9QFI6_9SPHI|nr:hypothetical protein [Pedobacter roseus]QNN42111.1 hypothetical protein H9L23_23960 [Pedobacter roseus]
MKKNLLSLITIFLLFSCKPSEKDLTQIVIKKADDGFIDLMLNIVSKKETDSTVIFKAQGLDHTDTVGLEISLKKNIKAGIVNGEMKNTFLANGISFQSTGKESDRLVTALTKLYNLKSKNKMRTDKMTFEVANLNETDVDYNSGQYRFKAFLPTDDDIPELFVNFDFTNKLIALNEKDPEYRTGVISYLTKKQ